MGKKDLHGEVIGVADKESVFYSIGEIAELFGHTPGAIRFFEESDMIQPKRDISERRQYTVEDILSLLYLKKFCSFGLTIKETVEYFKDSNTKEITNVTELLKEKSETAKQWALYYQQSSKIIEEYYEKLNKLDSTDTKIITTNFPASFLMDIDYLLSKNREKRKTAQKWIAAIPLVGIKMLFNIHDKRPSNIIGLYVSKKDAADLNLPIPKDIKSTKVTPCYYTISRLQLNSFQPIDEFFLHDLVKRAEKKRHPLSGDIIHGILFTHKIEGIHFRYVEFWLPWSGAWKK